MPVAPEEQIPVPLRKLPEKVRQDLRQLPVLRRPDRVPLPAGEALAELLQHQGELSAAPLLRLPGPAGVAGQISGDGPQKGSQLLGPLGRHGVPGPQPGVVDALLRVPPVPQQVHGDGPAQRAVLPAAGLNGQMAAGPVQVHDLMIVHRRSLLSRVALTLYVGKKSRLVAPSGGFFPEMIKRRAKRPGALP